MATKQLQTNNPTVKASARELHVAPRKMRLVTNLVRGMNAVDALTQLQQANKKASPMLIKLLESAIANAKNNFSLDASHLYIKSITTDMGSVLTRYFPRARGSAFPIRRKLCHVTVVLEERKQGKAAKGRFSLLNRTDKKESKETQNVDQAEATSKEPKASSVQKPQVFKSDEQIKMNKVSNKRRLFNRKSGE